MLAQGISCMMLQCNTQASIISDTREPKTEPVLQNQNSLLKPGLI